MALAGNAFSYNTLMADCMCPLCGKPFEIAVYLSKSSYSTNTDSGYGACPNCGKGVEFRVKSNSIEFGYTYWAGSMHFEGMETVAVPGLRLELSGDSASFMLKGATITVSRPK